MRPPRPSYALVASDREAGVRVGAQVVYSLVRTNVVSVAEGAGASISASTDAILATYPTGHDYTRDGVLAPRVTWGLYDEQPLSLTPPGETNGFANDPGSPQYEVAVEWTRAGTHAVRCFVEIVEPWGKGYQVITHSQLVRTAEEDAEVFSQHWAALQWMSGLADAETAVLTRPENAAIRISRALEVAELLDEKHPTTDPTVRASYAERNADERRVASRLYELALGLGHDEHRRHALNGLHSNAVDNVTLTLFMAIGHEPRVSKHEDQVGDLPRASAVIVDWTDPASDVYSGTHRGSGATVADAIANVLLNWRRNCRYPEGEVRFGLPPPLAEVLGAGARTGRLDANKQRLLFEKLGLTVHAQQSGLPLDGSFRAPPKPVDLATVLDGVTIAAALVAFGVTVCAPVPGSRVVSALLWTSAIAGAAGSTVRIISRYERDVSDPTATAIDVLGLVSSVLMIPSAMAVWRAGAKIAVREAAVLGRGDRVLKMTLVGQITADGVTGVLIGKEGLARLHEVLEDGSKDPRDRLATVAKLVAQLVATGALVGIGAKANLDDLAALRSRGDAGLRRLGDEGAEIDLTDGAGSAGRTGRGKHHDIADLEPPGDGRVKNARAQLTPAARARLGEFDIPTGAAVRAMLDADGVSANMLIERFGREATDLAKSFVKVWRRWKSEDLPTAWLRMYHDLTGLHGVRYFAELPTGKAGRMELAAGGWACMRELRFKAVYDRAGHSVARHGPQIPAGVGEALEERVKKGLSAEVALHTSPHGPPVWQQVAAPSARSSRFLSFVDWLEAHDSVYFALKKDFFDKGPAVGPIIGKNGTRYPKAAGYFRMVDAEDSTREIIRPLGEGFKGDSSSQGTARLTRLNGEEFEGVVYGRADQVHRDEITYIFATIAWSEREKEWILINLYPAALPTANTSEGLKKKPADGHEPS